MSDPTRVQGILFAHGTMAEGMVDAVRRIAGISDGVLVALSNEGLRPEQLATEIDRLAGDRPALVFTDLHSGSCAVAAHMGTREREDRAVVCGVNLPMLLDFVFHLELPLEDLLERMMSKGREGMRVIRSSD